jgi:hypothetical protein
MRWQCNLARPLHSGRRLWPLDGHGKAQRLWQVVLMRATQRWQSPFTVHAYAGSLGLHPLPVFHTHSTINASSGITAQAAGLHLHECDRCNVFSTCGVQHMRQISAAMSATLQLVTVADPQSSCAL